LGNTTASQNTSRHIQSKVSIPYNLLIRDWLRLVIIIGGYLLVLRPLLLRYGAKLQQQQLEKEDARTKQETTINQKEEDGKAREGLKWGTNARIRQRKATEALIEKREDSDDELQELLDDS
jgi:hypothetical protein